MEFIEINGKKYIKSSASYRDGGRCVGVCIEPNNVYIVNTNDNSAPIKYSIDEWRAFIEGVKAGEFDIGASLR